MVFMSIHCAYAYPLCLFVHGAYLFMVSICPWCISDHGACVSLMTSLVAQMVKCLPTMWETRVKSLGG